MEAQRRANPGSWRFNGGKWYNKMMDRRVHEALGIPPNIPKSGINPGLYKQEFKRQAELYRREKLQKRGK